MDGRILRLCEFILIVSFKFGKEEGFVIFLTKFMKIKKVDPNLFKNNAQLFVVIAHWEKCSANKIEN